jgi:predicted Fe-Mo cluster-binding NifX family protein
MKIAVTSQGGSLDSQVDPRFGRAAYFVIVDTSTMEFETIENQNIAASGGAGIGSAKTVIDAGAQAVLTGNCGPNAHKTLTAAGIRLFTCLSGTIAEAIETYKSGKAVEPSGPNVKSHSGMDA